MCLEVVKDCAEFNIAVSQTVSTQTPYAISD